MHCAQCGGSLNEGAKFCTACGASVVQAKALASRGQRLGNLLLDYLFGFIVSVCIGWFFLVVLPSPLGGILGIFFIYFGTLVYYVVFESVWGRTPGKWITKTKVVRHDGEPPHFLQVIGRTLARCIPFEIFSFLGAKAYGWHDHLSNTIVVPQEYTSEDVRAMYPTTLKPSGTAIIIAIGFVVVMFIGILASIVLVSLGNARVKAQDALIQSQLLPARVSAEVYWTEEQGYEGLCENVRFDVDLRTAAFTATENPEAYGCVTTKETWMAGVLMPNGGIMCIDSSGVAPRVVDPSAEGGALCKDFPLYAPAS